MTDGTLFIDGNELSVNVLRLEPGDKIALSIPRGMDLSQMQMDELRSRAEKLFAPHAVVLLAGGVGLSIVRTA